ncbi:phage tail tip lysozyme [Lactiplantibacillus plantarum]|uniref:phage tail tip lysozyme n=1 Tax=Lactiplantibacillus plantarum TaxID=1590 RepID=UPI001BA516EA|nr:phage tail tip lysozyme [Lactiplantibacillus plantarum]MBS0935697.1 CHAP domain-containing protein [Lactiplantibacillus plantarum]MBS0943946.1 CHAP domain-containing protein [Lactiplantibacillus plantarum]
MLKKVILIMLVAGLPIFIVIALILGLTMVIGSDDDNDCQVTTNPSSNVVTSADMNKNAKTIYNYLRSTDGIKATPQAAAGIMGVWQFESSFNPGVANTGGSGATGLAQWMAERLTGANGLKTIAAKQGKKWDSLDGQLNFMKYEMNHGYQGAKHIFKETDVHRACYDWLMEYEGMRNNPEQWFLEKGPSGQPGRYPLSDHWFAKFGASDPGTSDSLDLASDSGAKSSDNSSDCNESTANDGDILATAKGWLGYFYYVQSHPSKDLGSDLKNPDKNGGTDCSGYVWLVLNKAGYKVPANMGWFTGTMASDATGKHQYLKAVDKTDAKAGDIVIVNQGAGSGNDGHTAILTEDWHGNSTRIIESGGTGKAINIAQFGNAFSSLLSGDITFARAIKK